MRIAYHNDLDGRCAAYWVAKRFNNFNPEDFIEMDYGKDTDWFSKIKKDEKVIIVDFSLEPDMMRKLLEKTKDVIWIDHHISAINKYKDFEHEIKGLRYDGIAGCMLTYCFFFEMKDGKLPFNPSMTSTAPWFTKYIADYDVWKYEYGDETTHFILAMDAQGIIKPIDNIWNELHDISKVKEFIKDGTIIEKYRSSLGQRAVEGSSFEYEIGGIKTLCMNNNDCFSNSTWFGDKIKEYDMVCAFSFNSEQWIYSLYADTERVEKKGIDCSKIAEQFGGGGHKGAAGFSSKEFIFKDLIK